MFSFTLRKLLYSYLILTKIYCGFVLDSYISLTNGAIKSFSYNRHDPRFILIDYTRNTSIVCAINYQTLWIVKNITGSGYQYVTQRNYHLNSFSERTFFIQTSSIFFFDENLTTQVAFLISNGQTLSFGEGPNQLVSSSSSGNQTMLLIKNINNNTIKWGYSFPNYNFLKYAIHNNRLIALMAPQVSDGTILLEVWNIVNQTLSLLNQQKIICSSTSGSTLGVSSNYYAVYNGSQIQIFTYCDNCLAIWALNYLNVMNLDFCGPWFFYSSNGAIFQHYANNGTFISSVQTKFNYPRMRIIEINFYCLMNIFEYNQSTILRFYIDNNTGLFVDNQTSTSFVDFSNYTNLLISNSSFLINSSNSALYEKYQGYELSKTFLQQNFTVTPFSQSILLTTTALNSFRMGNFIRIFLIINQLGFHNYHNINYTGIVKNILDFMKYFQANIWVLTNSKYILESVQNIYFLPSYIQYTNSKFLEVEGKDSLFLENTKDYFIMYVPASTLYFISLYLLYKVLNHFQLKIKTLIKSYSLSYGIILVLFVDNLSRLSLLACHNFQHLFSFNTLLYFIQGLTIIFIGFVIILSISFFYQIKYLYGKKIQSISFNLRRISSWPTIQTLRFVLRPIIEIACNVFFFSNYNYAIFSLCILELSIVLILSGYQISKRCFKNKFEFIDECLFNLILCLFNFILYLKYEAYPQLEVLFQWCIQKLIFLFMVIFILDLLRSGTQIIKLLRKICEEQENSQQQNKGKNLGEESKRIKQQSKNHQKTQKKSNKIVKRTKQSLKEKEKIKKKQLITEKYQEKDEEKNKNSRIKIKVVKVKKQFK